MHICTGLTAEALPKNLWIFDKNAQVRPIVEGKALDRQTTRDGRPALRHRSRQRSATGWTIRIFFDIPGFLERPLIAAALLYRWLRYGYRFRRIALTQGKYAIVDPEDYEFLCKLRWHVHKAPPTFYAVHSLTNGRKERRRNVRMHQLVLKVPAGMLVDHINRNGLDNRKANLRPATFAQNVWNRSKFKGCSRSKYKGVDWLRKQNRWRARIRVNGRRIYLGSFTSEPEAAKAYDAAARHYHGDFAGLNFDGPRQI